MDIVDSPTPEDISKVINENMKPGTLGLVETIDQTEEPVNTNLSLGIMANLAKYLSIYSGDLLKHCQAGDVREVRKSLTELFGAVDQAKLEAEKLAKHYGLPNIKV